MNPWGFIHENVNSDSSLLDGMHEQNPKVDVTILVANADSTAMQYGDQHYDDTNRSKVKVQPNRGRLKDDPNHVRKKRYKTACE